MTVFPHLAKLVSVGSPWGLCFPYEVQGIQPDFAIKLCWCFPTIYIAKTKRFCSCPSDSCSNETLSNTQGKISKETSRETHWVGMDTSKVTTKEMMWIWPSIWPNCSVLALLLEDGGASQVLSAATASWFYILPRGGGLPGRRWRVAGFWFCNPEGIYAWQGVPRIVPEMHTGARQDWDNQVYVDFFLWMIVEILAHTQFRIFCKNLTSSSFIGAFVQPGS